MGKTKNLGLGVLGLLAAVLLASGCVNNGTEIGNPGSKRAVTGALAADASIPASCPSANGPISVILATAAGSEVLAGVSESGGFSTEIDLQERYEVVFRQHGETCGELYYGPDDAYAGAHVVLGKGTQDIDVGEIADFGNGVFVAANDPSAFCDDDGDGIVDPKDADADGDGVDDTEVGGYIDWFYENEAAETTP